LGLSYSAVDAWRAAMAPQGRLWGEENRLVLYLLGRVH
jgi:hypothetical protein